jgi:hypothetical protein
VNPVTRKRKGTEIMKTLKFNTGREYTKNGQRIAAILQDNGDIVFNDIDRSICGIIRAGGFTLEDVITLNCFTQRGIMESYDQNDYTDISGDWELKKSLADIAATL